MMCRSGVGLSWHHSLAKRRAHFWQDTADSSRNEKLEASGACDGGSRDILIVMVESLGF